MEARFTYGTALFGFAAAVPEGRIAGLERDRRVAYVDLDGEVHAFAPSWCDDDSNHPACDDEDDDGGDDSGQTLPWGVDRIDADLNTETAKDVHVYVLDTGIDSDHVDLQGNLGNGHAVEQCKGGTCIESWDDDNGHGTHVAGTIGAIDNNLDVVGVAPDVTLHAVKVLAKRGSGSRSGVIDGLDWVAREVAGHGEAAVANMSLGGSGSKDGTCSDGGFEGSDSYHQAICDAAHTGVVFAVAAGNDGADAESIVPAAYDDAVITVTATDDQDAWTSWSNYGDGVDTDDDGKNELSPPAPVAIAGPGADVTSTAMGGGTEKKSGTSMAAPHVGGAAALYLASNDDDTSPNYTAFQDTQDALLNDGESTEDFDDPTDGNHHSEPFVDAENL